MAKREAAVAACRCPSHNNKLFGVRFEKVGKNKWEYNWAFKIDESAAVREGYASTKIVGEIAPRESEYPGCPYCGRKDFVICECGKIGCLTPNTRTYTCGWCGMTGELGAYDGRGFSGGFQ